MHGHDIRLSDEPGDIVHVDMAPHICTCTEEELEALREYFVLIRSRRA